MSKHRASREIKDYVDYNGIQIRQNQAYFLPKGEGNGSVELYTLLMDRPDNAGIVMKSYHDGSIRTFSPEESRVLTPLTRDQFKKHLEDLVRRGKEILGE